MHVFEQVLSGGIRDADRVDARSRVLQGGSKHERNCLLLASCTSGFGG